MKSLADIRNVGIYSSSSNTIIHCVNTSGCVFSAQSIRSNFAKFLRQDVSKLFSVQHFFLNWTSSLWVRTPRSSEALSTAITICLSQAWALCEKWGKPALNIILQGIRPFTHEKTRLSVTTANHCTDQEQKQKTSLEELREVWPLVGAVSNRVRRWLLAMRQCLQFFCPCCLFKLGLGEQIVCVYVCVLIRSIGGTTHNRIYALLASLYFQTVVIVIALCCLLHFHFLAYYTLSYFIMFSNQTFGWL